MALANIRWKICFLQRLKTKASQTLQNVQYRRTLWGWLNSVFNRVDPDRIKEVGPDRACAEWLLRCGAKVRWRDMDFWEQDYNMLPASNFERYKVEEIDATSSAIMGIGFLHLKGLKYVRRIILHDCRYLCDDALELLPLVKETLEYLQISNCGDITYDGLLHLRQLSKLKNLILFSLPEVTDYKKAEEMLKSSLPHCDVHFTEFQPSNEQKSDH